MDLPRPLLTTAMRLVLLLLQAFSFCSPSEASLARTVAGQSRTQLQSVASKPTVSPCDEWNDYAEVGSTESDVCQESRLQLEVVTQTLVKERRLRRVFESIFQSCGTGKQNLQCVSRVAYEDNPEDYLEWCNLKMGPQSTASGAVCKFAKMNLDTHRKTSFGYKNLIKLLKWSQDSCRGIPYACVANADQCLDAQDVQFCFLECIKQGNMAHQMLTKPMIPDTNGCNCGDGVHACLDFSDSAAPSPAAASPASSPV